MANENDLPVGSAAEDEENGGDAMTDINLNDLDTVNDDPMAEDVSPENIDDDDDYGPGVDDEELDDEEFDDEEDDEADEE